MSGLENLLGGAPINQLPSNVLPTLRDILLFYSSFWKKKGSDSLKEKMVAQELIKIYEEANIPILSELTIKSKIKRNVVEFKKILKFQRKSKTPDNLRIENGFISRLGEIFEVRITREIPESYASGSDNSFRREIEANGQDFSDGI